MDIKRILITAITLGTAFIVVSCNSNPGPDSISSHTAQTTGMLMNCGLCHNVAVGSRRAVMGTNGDFGLNPGRASHHITGNADPTAAQCLICHNVDQHGSGTVRLNDADTSAVIPYTSSANMETFCLSCHDTDGASTNMSPFADGAVLGTLYDPKSVGYPTTNQAVTTGWTDPNNAHADDGVYATAAPAQNAFIDSRWGGFGFDSLLPAPPYTARIDAVKIIAEYRVNTNTSIASLAAQATIMGADCPAVAQVNTVEPLSDTVVTFDVTSCRSWTRDDLLDANFQVRIGARRGNSATAVNFSLDNVRVEVTYNKTGYKASTEIETHWNKTYGHKQKGLTCIGNGNPNTGCHLNGHGTVNVGLLARNLTLPQLDGNCYSPVNENDYDLCFSCHASYPNVAKEAVLGMRQSGNYDLESFCNVAAGAYNIPNILTNFRDAYTGGPNFYDDAWFTTGHDQLHTYHVQITPAWLYRDSVDSGIVCNSCHNVHGSNNQYGMLFDEIQYNHYTDGPNQYGTMDLLDFIILENSPTNCTFNCHDIAGKSYNWFEPADE